MEEKQSTDNLVETRMSHLQIFCGALLFSFFIYLGLIASGILPQTGPESLRETIGYKLAGIAVFELLAAVVVRKLLYNNKIKSCGGQCDTRQVLNAYFVATIVAFVMWDSVGLFAIVVYMMTGNSTLAFALCALGILAMALGWPRRSAIGDDLNRAVCSPAAGS